MSSYSFDAADTFEGGSSFIAKPGTYHIMVSNVDPEPVTKDGKAMEGLKVEGGILGGTEPTEKDKTIEFMLWAPKPTDKNNGEMAKRKLTRFAYAMGFIDEFKPGQKINIDCEVCEGRQLVAKFSEQERDGKKRIELHFSDIYHVDDPAVAEIPKAAQAISVIPKSLRKAIQPKPTAKKEQPAMAGAGAPNLDNI